MKLAWPKDGGQSVKEEAFVAFYVNEELIRRISILLYCLTIVIVVLVACPWHKPAYFQGPCANSAGQQATDGRDVSGRLFYFNRAYDQPPDGRVTHRIDRTPGLVDFGHPVNSNHRQLIVRRHCWLWTMVFYVPTFTYEITPYLPSSGVFLGIGKPNMSPLYMILGGYGRSHYVS